MNISLNEILQISKYDKYKVHLATTSDEGVKPLDVFVRDRNEWKNWNRWKGSKNIFNRPYIFSLIDFYSETNVWLFGGIFEVLSRSEKDYSHSYDVQLADFGKQFVGRLKIKFPRPGRTRAIKFEKYFQDMIVMELLKHPYYGEKFPGYENICHGFNELENIFKNNKKDWRASLESIKGVYLIMDKNNGKSYVGSAYGEWGIWSRWKAYIETGHGWNNALTKVIEDKGIEYARKYFQFSLLEFIPNRTSDTTIIARENYWKEVLLSRSDKFGYNKN